MTYSLPDLCASLTDDPGQDTGTHYAVLYSLARFLPAKVAVEIGVDDGSTTLPLLLGVTHAGGHLYSVDVASCLAAQQRVAASGMQGRWSFFIQPSVEFAERWVNTNGPALIDLVFIDGDHSPEGVRADWEAFSPLVRVGGLVLFHDAMNTRDFPGILDLIDGTIKKNPAWEISTIPYGFGLSIARRLA